MDSLHRFSIERLTSNSTDDSQMVQHPKVDDWQNTTMFLKDYWQNYSSTLQHPAATQQQLQPRSSILHQSPSTQQYHPHEFSNMNVSSNALSSLPSNVTSLATSNALHHSTTSDSSHSQSTSNGLQHNQIYPVTGMNSVPRRDSLSPSTILPNTQKQAAAAASNNLSQQQQNEHNIEALINQNSPSLDKSYDILHSSAFTTPGISHPSTNRCNRQQSITEVTKEVQPKTVLRCQEDIDVPLESISDVDSDHGNSDDDKDDSDEKDKSPQKSNDPNEKPQHSYIALISEAILSYPERKLVLSDIYQFIMDNYPYYNNQERAWRNSIRHNLSLNECFIKAGRAENGKGNYWAIHPACVEDFSKGDYRRRHARRRARGGPYADVNVSALPYNYRCNLGYVPMTPTPAALGYPYHLPYLHSLSHQSTSNLFSRMASNDITANHMTQSSPKKGDNMYLFKDSTRPDYKASSSVHTPGVSSYQANKNTLLPHSYLPNVLSQSLRYSPYHGFTFF